MSIIKVVLENLIQINFKINSENYFVSADNVDLFGAVDEAKDILMRDITKTHAKKRTLFHRGARKVKNLFKR